MGKMSATVKGAPVLCVDVAPNGDCCKGIAAGVSPGANLKSGAPKGDAAFKGGAEAVIEVDGLCVGAEKADCRFSCTAESLA